MFFFFIKIHTFVHDNDRDMKKRLYISSFFLLISILLLMIPVIPHHHHASEMLCMKNDISAECCSHHHDAGDEHCCCNAGCLARHLILKQTPADDLLRTDALQVVTLFAQTLSNISLHEPETKEPESGYLELLHDTFITCDTGLRAPPFTLA